MNPALEDFLDQIGEARPRWHARAACRGLDPDLFFPARGASLAEARSVCQDCPVTAECLSAAVGGGERHGVWAGTSARQRRQLRSEAA